MYIFEMNKVTDEIVQAFKRLMPQLTEYSPPPSEEILTAMANSSATIVFLARLPNSNGKIIGSATLGTFMTPTGLHGWIEDVVVDQEARRQGVGKALTEACLERSRVLALREVNLTSRPSREAANRLYQSMGFIQRETNVYRYPLE